MGLETKAIVIPQQNMQFDLQLDVLEKAGIFEFHWHYAKELFTEKFIGEMHLNFECLLQQGLANLDAPFAQLKDLNETDQQYQLIALNSTAMDYPTDVCIHRLFEQQVQATPEATALVFEDARLTYRELNTRANQLARYLRAEHQVGPDTLVGLCVERSIEMVVGLVGILKAGGAYVPLDPEYPASRLAYMRQDADLKVILTQQRLTDQVEMGDSSVVLLDTDSFNDYDSTDLSPAETGVTAQHLAYVIYTSGSTGKPKGVELAHQGVLNYLSNVREYIPQNVSNTLMSSSLNFDATVTSLYGGWLQGGYTTLLNPGKDLFQQLEMFLQSDNPTLFKVTPAHLQGLTFTSANSTPHVIVVGGEAFTRDIAEKSCRLLPSGR